MVPQTIVVFAGLIALTLGAPISDDAAAAVVNDRTAMAKEASVMSSNMAASPPVDNFCQQGSQKYMVGDTWISAMFKLQCMSTGLSKTIACVSNGLEIPVGTSVNKENRTYNCYENPSGAHTFFVTDATNLGIGMIQNNEFVKQEPKAYGAAV